MQLLINPCPFSLHPIPLVPCPANAILTPKPKKVFPCGIYSKSVNDNHNAVLCDICDQWIHIKCNYLNKSDYLQLQNSKNTLFCLNCIKESLPFSFLNNNEFFVSVIKGALNTKSVNLDFMPSEFQQNMFEQLNNYVNKSFLVNDDNDDDDYLTQNYVNCQYYGINEFTNANFCSSRTFSILNFNIHSIVKHIDEFGTIQL